MRKIRIGMVGGGRGAFIGAVHRSAAAIDGKTELVCGAFSSDPKKAKASGKDLNLPPERCYGSYEEMLTKEAALPAGERMDLVVIVTPNFMHAPVIAAAIKAGFHVICDKPLCMSLAEAKQLKRLIDKSDRIFAMTYTYTGYPMVKQARAMIQSGKYGKVRKVVVEYPQGWLTDFALSGGDIAMWRTDPKRAGGSCCMGDIGTHAENLSEYLTGLKISELCADLHSFTPGIKLEDDGNVLLHFEGGASGLLHASQISVNDENNLNIRVYCERAGFEWHQVEPNTLLVKPVGAPTQIYRAGCGNGYLDKSAQNACRTPCGHPEGYYEAFANIYTNVATTIQARLAGKKPPAAALDFPGIDDGVRGMAFLDTILKSAKSKTKWTKFSK